MSLHGDIGNCRTSQHVKGWEGELRSGCPKKSWNSVVVPTDLSLTSNID